MTKTFESLKNSLHQFPPFYPSEKDCNMANCYAHALNMSFVKQDYNNPIRTIKFFIPGSVTAAYNESDIFNDGDIEATIRCLNSHNRYHMAESEVERFEFLFKRDCQKLGLRVERCEFDHPSSESSYKVLFCTNIYARNSWHFVRESRTWEGEKIWTHKLGWPGTVEEIVLTSMDDLVKSKVSPDSYEIRRCYEVFFK